MSLANIGQQPAKTIERLERANDVLARLEANHVKRIVELHERINEVEAENKILREGIARLSRITHIETQEAGK